MTDRTARKLTLAEFERLLDVYGADRTRWPLSARAGAVALLTAEPDARRLLVEASALDALLSKVPEADTEATAALAARIVAATQRTPRLVASMPPKAQAAKVASGAGWWRRRLDADLQRGLAMMAACLVVGVFLGQSQVGARAVPALEALTGMSVQGTADQLALADLHLEATDED